jgi:hypothetical protein
MSQRYLSCISAVSRPYLRGISLPALKDEAGERKGWASYELMGGFGRIEAGGEGGGGRGWGGGVGVSVCLSVGVCIMCVCLCVSTFLCTRG